MSEIDVTGRTVRRDRGFTLVEMAIVILVIGLIAGIGADLMRGVERRGRVERTEAALVGLEEALAAFVMLHKRLPCPADGGLADGDPGAGRESFEGGGPGDCVHQIDGVVPTVALAIGTAAGSDGWRRRITYRVDPVLTRDRDACAEEGACACPGGGMDLSCIDPRRIGEGQGGIDDVLANFQDGGLGLRVCTQAECPQGSDVMLRQTGTGAAYVLVSHGHNGLGALTNGGTRIAAPDDETPLNELPNFAAIALDDIQAGPREGGAFVDRERIDRDPRERDIFFDDYVLRPSVLHVARAARLEPQAAP